jgi:hypothetical protein
VDLITRNQAHVQGLKENGATICYAEGDRERIPVNALTPAEMSERYDVIFLMTKQRNNKEIVTDLFPYLKDISNSKFKLKDILIFGIIFTFLNIFITIREGLSLGILVTNITFPQYEILRFLSITTYSLPLDIIFIIYLFFFSFYTLGIINNHLYHSLNINNFHLKNIITIIPFLLAIILINNFTLFNMIKYDLIVISSFCLVYIFLSTLINYLRSNLNE